MKGKIDDKIILLKTRQISMYLWTFKVLNRCLFNPGFSRRAIWVVKS